MKIYLAMMFVDDWTGDDREETHEEILKAFDSKEKAEDFLREFVPNFDWWFYSGTEFIEKNDEIEDGGDFALCNRHEYRTGEYTLLRHFEEQDCLSDQDPSSVELLVREMNLD